MTHNYGSKKAALHFEPLQLPRWVGWTESLTLPVPPSHRRPCGLVRRLQEKALYLPVHLSAQRLRKRGIRGIGEGWRDQEPKQ